MHLNIIKTDREQEASPAAYRDMNKITSTSTMKLLQFFILNMLVLIMSVNLIAADSGDAEIDNSMIESNHYNSDSSEIAIDDSIELPQTEISNTNSTETIMIATTKTAVTEEELQSKVIMDEMNSVMNSTLLHFSKIRSQISSKFLNKILPRLRSINNNITSLLNSENSLSSYKEADDNLDNQLMTVKEIMDNNRILLDKYSLAYGNTEQQLKAHHETLESILLPALNGYTDMTSMETKKNSSNRWNWNRNYCGTFLLPNNETSIEYKSEKNLDAHEGCLWMISAGYSQVSQFQISLQSMGFIPTNTTFLSIGYFSSNNYTNEENFKWQKVQRASEVLEITAANSVVLVHFVSSPQEGPSSSVKKGFRLNVKVIHRDPTLGNNFHRIYKGAARYHQEGLYYDNERTIFVVQPEFQPFTFQLLWWDFENNILYDSLSVWAFDESFKWRKQDTFFSKRGSSYVKSYPSSAFSKTRSDPIILLFQSDTTIRGGGFEWNVTV